MIVILSILPGCQVAKGAVRPEPVVLLPPLLDLSLRFLQRLEPVAVQALLAKACIEALDERVLERATEVKLYGSQILRQTACRPHVSCGPDAGEGGGGHVIGFVGQIEQVGQHLFHRLAAVQP